MTVHLLLCSFHPHCTTVCLALAPRGLVLTLWWARHWQKKAGKWRRESGKYAGRGGTGLWSQLLRRLRRESHRFKDSLGNFDRSCLIRRNKSSEDSAVAGPRSRRSETLGPVSRTTEKATQHPLPLLPASYQPLTKNKVGALSYHDSHLPVACMQWILPGWVVPTSLLKWLLHSFCRSKGSTFLLCSLTFNKLSI